MTDANTSRPALSPPAEGDVRMTDEEWEDRCTCCDNTGITIQTERRCACQPPLTPTPAPVDWERVGPKLVERLTDDLEAEIKGRYGDDILSYPGIKRKFDADMEIVTEARAALAATQSNGE